MSVRGNSENCVEEPVAPEWLSKLESRRENLRRANKLGHESGAGAPCGECGDKCPGLDLHFWRKVCRNCKCRKDQHKCVDDDLSNWAQFEILGQICAKPAFIKINALASQPLCLEWVPPNAAPDVVSDYMITLGTAKVPIAGSDAAYKRKQQLEFQVPPHDLDAALCDNLTESEALQLNQYVQKIRDNCVGQGSVVRIGSVGIDLVGYTSTNDSTGPDDKSVSEESQETMEAAKDIVKKLVDSRVIGRDQVSFYANLFSVFFEPKTSEIVELETASKISIATKQKFHGLSCNVVCSLVQNGVIFDKILATLKENNIEVNDARIQKIADFRQEYHTNPQFREEVNVMQKISQQIRESPNGCMGCTETSFNSPLPVKHAIQARVSTQMRQDTPIRRLKFSNVSTVMYDCELPIGVDYEKDPVFANIIYSESLRQALKEARAGLVAMPVVINQTPMLADFVNASNISATTKQTLKKIGVNCKAMQSMLANSEYYDVLFATLKNNRIEYPDCKLLVPLKNFREEILVNKPLQEEVCKFVAELPNSSDITYGNPDNVRKTLSGSSSIDSGFGSKASTPNCGIGYVLPSDAYQTDIQYKEDVSAGLPSAFQQLRLPGENMPNSLKDPPPTVIPKCQDCKQSIYFGDVAVKAERAGKDIVWHPQCFKCYTCRELLADLVYFFHGGKVYCGRDLAINLKIPRCKACDELIFTKEYTAAEGATFHIKHFCCYHCDIPLAGQQYVPDEKSNMPLCLKCYNEYFAAGCQRCGRPIEPSDQGVAWGETHWHGTCFICAGVNCGKSLIGGRFCVKQKMPFCSPRCVRSVSIS